MRPPRRRLAVVATAVAVLTAAAGAGLAARQPPPRPIRHTVTVTALPTQGATADITTTSGGHVTPPWGQPVTVTGTITAVSALTWADRSGGACVIVVDGTVVAQLVEPHEGRPASCMWP